MKEHERKQLLERVNRDSATVGARIPDTVTISDEEMDLREFLFEIKRQDSIPPDVSEEVDDAKQALRQERNDRLETLETADISRADGDRLAEEIVGIDRALNALENLRSSSLDAEARRRETADQKRWMAFIKQVLGKK